jgi:hypothetical protein
MVTELRKHREEFSQLGVGLETFDGHQASFVDGVDHGMTNALWAGTVVKIGAARGRDSAVDQADEVRLDHAKDLGAFTLSPASVVRPEVRTSRAGGSGNGPGARAAAVDADPDHLVWPTANLGILS